MKKRTLNELRQTKEYGYKPPINNRLDKRKETFGQGKTESQLRASYMGAFFGFMGLFLMGIIYLFSKLF